METIGGRGGAGGRLAAGRSRSRSNKAGGARGRRQIGEYSVGVARRGEHSLSQRSRAENKKEEMTVCPSGNKGANADPRCPAAAAERAKCTSVGRGAATSCGPRAPAEGTGLSAERCGRDEGQPGFPTVPIVPAPNQSLTISPPSLQQHVGISRTSTFRAASAAPPRPRGPGSLGFPPAPRPLGEPRTPGTHTARFCPLNIWMASARAVSDGAHCLTHGLSAPHHPGEGGGGSSVARCSGSSPDPSRATGTCRALASSGAPPLPHRRRQVGGRATPCRRSPPLPTVTSPARPSAPGQVRFGRASRRLGHSQAQPRQPRGKLDAGHREPSRERDSERRKSRGDSRPRGPAPGRPRPHPREPRTRPASRAPRSRNARGPRRRCGLLAVPAAAPRPPRAPPLRRQECVRPVRSATSRPSRGQRTRGPSGRTEPRSPSRQGSRPRHARGPRGRPSPPGPQRGCAQTPRPEGTREGVHIPRDGSSRS